MFKIHPASRQLSIKSKYFNISPIIVSDFPPFRVNCVFPTSQDDKDPSVRDTFSPDLIIYNTRVMVDMMLLLH